MALVRKESSYKSATKKADIDIRYVVWTDASVKKPIGVVQLTHGWGEYIDRYEPLAAYLAEAGYVVCGQDHIAHGKTSGVLAEQVYPSDAHKAMIDDMHTLYEIMHKKYPKLPYYLYGHSMGSMMTRLYLPKYSEDLDGAIVCGTVPMPHCLTLISPCIRMLGRLFSRSFEKEAAKSEKKFEGRSEELSDEAPTKLEMIINSWLSYDKDNIINYVQDPYDGAPINATVLYVLAMMMGVTPRGWAKKIDKDLPIFVISGKADLAGLYTMGPKQVNKLLKKADRNVEMKLYKGKHEIHNEVANGTSEKVFKDILDFLNDNNKKAK